MVNQTIPRPSLMVYAPGDPRLRSIPYFHGMWTLGYTKTLIEQHRITSRYMRSLVYLTNELSSQHVCTLFHMKPLSFMLIMLKLKPVAQLICWPPNQWRIQDFIFGGVLNNPQGWSRARPGKLFKMVISRSVLVTL